jgi:hypothetical protein
MRINRSQKLYQLQWLFTVVASFLTSPSAGEKSASMGAELLIAE